MRNLSLITASFIKGGWLGQVIHGFGPKIQFPSKKIVVPRRKVNKYSSRNFPRERELGAAKPLCKVDFTTGCKLIMAKTAATHTIYHESTSEDCYNKIKTVRDTFKSQLKDDFCCGTVLTSDLEMGTRRMHSERIKAKTEGKLFVRKDITVYV